MTKMFAKSIVIFMFILIFAWLRVQELDFILYFMPFLSFLHISISEEYSVLLYGWVCFRHAIGQFAVRNLLYGQKCLKKMLISEP